ncbi:MAG: hypothetical protein ACXV5P_09915 [Halobacteriota archaeon]
MNHVTQLRPGAEPSVVCATCVHEGRWCKVKLQSLIVTEEIYEGHGNADDYKKVSCTQEWYVYDRGDGIFMITGRTW